jgi:uncharacterized membrane protein
MRRGFFTPLVIAAAVMLAGCGDSSASRAPSEPTVRFKVSSGSPSVSSANPASAFQGTNLDVQINGSGFDNGSKASWNLRGVPNGKIVVNRTSFVSSSQLVANVSIASDAAIDLYDVVVTTSTLKQGIGSDAFAVTLATAIPVVGQAINDGGQIVGQARSNGSLGALWDPQVGLVSIQSGSQLYAIDQSGSLIAGQVVTNYPLGLAAVWTSANGAAGPWILTELPSLGTGQSSARSVATNAQGRLILGGNLTLKRHNPAIWTQTDNGWQVTLLTLPSDILDGGWIQGINGLGMATGMDGVTCCHAFFWDASGAPSHLQPVAGATQAAAWSINADGTIIVGNSNGLAVMWTRTLANGVYGAWSQATALENTPQYCSGTSAANAVNAAGTVAVGVSCGQAMAWLIGNGTVVRFNLGGLGPPNTSVANAVNNLASPNAAGEANKGGVYWKNF